MEKLKREDVTLDELERETGRGYMSGSNVRVTKEGKHEGYIKNGCPMKEERGSGIITNSEEATLG